MNHFRLTLYHFDTLTDFIFAVMKPIHSLFILVVGILISSPTLAQNALLDFSVKELTKGKIQISWNNPYKDCIQLAVQKSADSSKNFRTIFSAQSPELAASGFVDNKPLQGIKSYYRIFYVLEGGAYYFTNAIEVEIKQNPVAEKSSVTETKKETLLSNLVLLKNMTAIYIKKDLVFSLPPKEYKRFKDSINKTKDGLHRLNEHAVEWKPAKPSYKQTLIRIYQQENLVAEMDKQQYLRFKDSIKMQTKDTLFAIDEWRIQIHSYVIPTKQYVFIYRNDTLVAQLETTAYKKFKDSVSLKTKDTLFAADNSHIAIHGFVPKYVWRPSQYIFTNTRGYVTIQLPFVKQHRYHIIFYEEDGTEVFRIKVIREPELIMDKTDFVHAGWFFFELFEDDKLKEKNKFFVSKD